MMYKKVVLILLVLALSITSILTGCVKTGPTTTGATTTKESTTEGPTTTTTPAGPTYSIPWEGDPVTFTAFCVDNRSPDNQFDGRIYKDLLESLGNITIEFNYVASADYATKTELALNTGDISDINSISGWTQEVVNKYGDLDYMLDFAPYLTYMPNYSEAGSMYPLVYGKKDDKILALDSGIGWFDFFSWNMNINLYYVNKYGIKAPTTDAELLDALRAVKKANPDCWAPYTVFPGGRLFVMLMQVYFGQPGEFADDSCLVLFDWKDTQKWFYPLYQPAYKDMVDFARTMYAEGLVPEDYKTCSWDKFVANLFKTGDGWFILGDWDLYSDKEIKAEQEVMPEFGLDFILPPTSKYQTFPALIPTASKGSNSYATAIVDAECKNPELACALLDYLYGKEVAELIGWGYEGESFERVAPGTGSYGSEYVLDPDLKAGPYYATGTIDPLKEFGLTYNGNAKIFGQLAGNFHGIYFMAQIANALTSQGLTDSYMKYANAAKDHPDWVFKREPTPPTTADENELITKIYTDSNTIIAKNMSLFITGERPMSEWDAFIAEVKAAGDCQQIADIYNSKPRVKVFAD